MADNKPTTPLAASFTYPYPTLTRISDTEPPAIPALWNNVYAEIDANFASLQPILSNVLSGEVAATTAKRWETARTITLSSDATGAITLDGSADVTLAVTLNEIAEEGTFGPDANMILQGGGAFVVPKITINTKGLVTAAKNVALALPKSKPVNGWATADLADGSVTTVKLADGAVTNAKIGNGTIAFVKFASGAVATQQEAETGAATDKIMTPIRAKQAFSLWSTFINYSTVQNLTEAQKEQARVNGDLFGCTAFYNACQTLLTEIQ